MVIVMTPRPFIVIVTTRSKAGVVIVTLVRGA